MAQIVLDGTAVGYDVLYRSVKYPRLEFKSGRLQVIVPLRRGPAAEEIICRHRRWVLDKLRVFESIEQAREQLLGLPVLTPAEFKTAVSRMVDEYAEALEVNVSRIVFRKMKARWGSCDCRGVITLNKYLRFLPETCVRYVVYHELMHLIYRSHGKRFRARIKKQFPDQRQLDQLLFAYDLLIKKEMVAEPG